MLTSWSCQGLLAHYCPQDPDRVILVDHTVPLSDPFYRQSLPLGNVEPLSIMQWNSSGTHLLLVHQSGSIKVFSQSPGLMNQFESTFNYASKPSDSKPILAFWCDNRRVFTCNYNSALSSSTTTTTSSSSNSNSLFTSRSFHFPFVPPGSICFAILFSTGLLDVFVLNETKIKSYEFKKVSISIPVEVESSSFISQRASNGQLLLFVRSTKDQNLSIFDISAPQDGEAKQLAQAQIPTSLAEKFIWSDTREILFHLSLQESGKCLQVSYFDLRLDEVAPPLTIALPTKMSEIVAGSWNFFFLQDAENEKSVWMANFTSSEASPVSLKQLQLDDKQSFSLNEEDDLSVSERIGPLVLSPNGLLVAKLTFDFGNFPLLSWAPIGEILPKNVSGIRDLLGKLVASSLNGEDSWDIFRIFQRTLFISTENQQDHDELYNCMSTILAEWINLAELSSIPLNQFYPKLLDLFNLMPVEFCPASGLIDLCLTLSSIERALQCSGCAIEDDTDDSGVAGDDYDSQMKSIISFENCPDSVISLLPVLKEGLRLIRDDSNPLLSLLFLTMNDESFRCVKLVSTATQAMTRHLTMAASRPHQEALLVKFYEQEAAALTAELFQCSRLQELAKAFRSDPQLQSKRTRNLFGFMIDFYLDPQNCKKVSSTLERIMSRFQQTLPNSSGPATGGSSKNEFFDSIRCIYSLLSPNSRILLCRHCHRITKKSSSKRPSRRELVFSADWQTSLWKFRCPCGSQRRILDITK